MYADLSKLKTAAERAAYVRTNKVSMAAMKKAAIKMTDAFAGPLLNAPLENGVTVKAVSASVGVKDTDTEINRTVIGNTYLWLDSHSDVHMPGVFSKSISERKPWHLHDHLFQITAQVGKVQGVSERAIDWKALNVDKEGQTTALHMETKIRKDMNAAVFEDYRAGEVQQHSVGMYYVRLDFAVNDKEDKEGLALWNKYLPMLGNPEKAEENGFFCIVHEAKLVEISCVLEGSNSLTPTLQNDNSSETKDSTEAPPADATAPTPQKSRFASLGSKIKNQSQL